MLRRSIESLESDMARANSEINRLQQEVDKLRIVSSAIICCRLVLVILYKLCVPGVELIAKDNTS